MSFVVTMVTVREGKDRMTEREREIRKKREREITLLCWVASVSLKRFDLLELLIARGK